MTDLQHFLDDKEWYDNSTLDTIDRCVRKGFWRTVFSLPVSDAEEKSGDIIEGAIIPTGVAENVGIGAHFGTCIHAAFDKYYSKLFFKTKTREQRRILAIRTFCKKYEQIIAEPDLVDGKYSLHRGIDLLDMYFDHYAEEDLAYEPVETEVAIICEITPRQSDPITFLPFWYVMRLDAVWRRINYDDLWVVEHKTASSPESKLTELLLSRQVRGYFWGISQFPADRPVEGVLANVLAVRAAESDSSKLFFRNYIHLTEADAEIFRLQTIFKVERWREVKRLAATLPPGPVQLAVFTQTPTECTRYGKCAYHDLCLYGPTGADLSKFQRNTWNPLYAEKLED